MTCIARALAHAGRGLPPTALALVLGLVVGASVIWLVRPPAGRPKASIMFEPPAAAPAAAPGGAQPVDLSLAGPLLRLTNLSAVTTAALLDAAGPLTPEKGRALMQLHQQLYCSAGVPDPPGAVRTKFGGNVSITVYQDNGAPSRRHGALTS